MKRELKERILHYVRRLDPNAQIVNLQPNDNWSGGTIRFSDKIKQHRVETSLKSEKWAEAFLVVRLVRELDYPIASLELQKEYPAGHPETTKPRVDIVVRDDRGAAPSTFMIIEAKDPDEYEAQKTGIEGQLFGLGDHERPHGLRYMIYYTIEPLADTLSDRALVIDALRFPTFHAWDQEGRPSLDELPADYTAAVKSVYVNKSATDLKPGEKALNTLFTRNDFASLRRDLHNVLWGGGGTPDNDIFATLVKLFLAKIYDEEMTLHDQPYQFQITYRDDQPETPDRIVKRLNSKDEINGHYVGIFRRAQKAYLEMTHQEIESSQGIDVEKVSPGKIAYVVEQLQGISLTRNENAANNDILGEFFEGIVRAGFKQTKGQFFTHSNIVRFCIYALKLDELAIQKIQTEQTLPFIVDPSCGSGTFLIEAMKTVTHTVKTSNIQQAMHTHGRYLIETWFPPPKQNAWAREFVYGLEIYGDLALATKVNMVLHGDGNINILSRDGLLDFDRYEITGKQSALAKKPSKPSFPYSFPINEQFDVLLSNPPFSVDLDNETKRGLTSRFQFATTKSSENLFIERWYQLLRPGGRMAVVIPEALLDTADNQEIRLFLFKYFHVKAIVSLPELTFQPFTPTRTSLLFAVKKHDDKVKQYDVKWREKDRRFRKLRDSPLIRYILDGQRLTNRSQRLLSKYKTRIHSKPTALASLDSAAEQLRSLPSETQLTQNDSVSAAGLANQIQEYLRIDVGGAYDRQQSIELLREFLKDWFDERLSADPLPDLVDRHWEEVVRVAASPWWTFNEVAKELDESILFFEVKNVGYKRTSKRERPAPNDLFTESNGRVQLDKPGLVKEMRSLIEY